MYWLPFVCIFILSRKKPIDMISLRSKVSSARCFLAKVMFLCMLFLLCIGSVQAQSKLSEQAFSDKLALYSQSDPSGLLFVHTDKTLYTNNEDLWFSTYLLKNGASSVEEHQVLSLALIRESDRSVYLQDKYMMVAGLAFGSLALPDSIPPGSYQLIASTNVLGLDSLPWPYITSRSPSKASPSRTLRPP